jgi:hypothetical protein
MHQVDRRPSAVRLIHFGFGGGRLWARIDVAGRALDLLAAGHEVSLKFVHPVGVRFSIGLSAGRATGVLWDRRDAEPHWVERGPAETAVAAGTIIELAIPLAALAVSPGDRLSFVAAIYRQGGAELERHPRDRTIEITVPDASFESRHWRV